MQQSAGLSRGNIGERLIELPVKVGVYQKQLLYRTVSLAAS
jgi:hypothetical protein